MAQNMWIGRANRLGRVGELVSVTIGKKIIKAKVARSFASLDVLVVASGDGQYFAYPSKVEQQRAIHNVEIFKNDKKKKPSKYHLDLVYLYFVVTSEGGFTPTTEGAIYLFDGNNSRFLRNIIYSELWSARVTNLGYGKYRCGIVSGKVLVGIDYYGNTAYLPTMLQIFTSETEDEEVYQLTVTNELEYPPNIITSSPEPSTEDWQDAYYRQWWIDDADIDACISERFMDQEDIDNERRIYAPSSLHGFPNLNTTTSTITYLSFHDILTGSLFGGSTNYPYLSTTEAKELLVTVGTYGPPFSYEETYYNYGDVCPVITIRDQLPLTLYPLELGFDYTYLQLLDLSIFYEEL